MSDSENRKETKTSRLERVKDVYYNVEKRNEEDLNQRSPFASVLYNTNRV